MLYGALPYLLQWLLALPAAKPVEPNSHGHLQVSARLPTMPLWVRDATSSSTAWGTGMLLFAFLVEKGNLREQSCIAKISVREKLVAAFPRKSMGGHTSSWGWWRIENNLNTKTDTVSTMLLLFWDLGRSQSPKPIDIDCECY